MKRVLKILGKFLLGFVILDIVVFVVLYLATIGTYEVAQTVAQDASLPSITLEGVTFHAETFGEASNPVVIVVHGGPGGDYRYLLNLQELSDEFYVVFYDQRGSGLSPRVDPSEITLDSSIEDLNRIVEHFGQGRPVNLVGHSWGAMLVTAYTGRYPDKVDHLVVAEPGFLTNEAYADFQRHFLEPYDLSLMAQATWIWFESLHVQGPDEYARDDYLLGRAAKAWYYSPKNGYNCPGAQPSDDFAWRAGASSQEALFNGVRDANGSVDVSILTEGLENFTGPVLMIVSECNRWVGLEHQRRYHLGLYSDIELVVIPNAGHDMFGENPQDSIAAVRDFLGR